MILSVQLGAPPGTGVIGDVTHLVSPAGHVARLAGSQPLQPLLHRDGDGASDRVSGGSRQLAAKSLCLVVLDVESHGPGVQSRSTVVAVAPSG